MKAFSLGKPEAVVLLQGISIIFVLHFTLSLLRHFVLPNAFPTTVLSWLSLLIAGWYVGRRNRQWGWIYGALTVAGWYFIFVVFSLSLFYLTAALGSLPSEYAIPDSSTFIPILASLPRELLYPLGVGALAGWLGQRFPLLSKFPSSKRKAR